MQSKSITKITSFPEVFDCNVSVTTSYQITEVKTFFHGVDLNFETFFPVNTCRRFNVHKSSIRSHRPRIDVSWTLKRRRVSTG